MGSYCLKKRLNSDSNTLGGSGFKGQFSRLVTIFSKSSAINLESSLKSRFQAKFKKSCRMILSMNKLGGIISSVNEVPSLKSFIAEYTLLESLLSIASTPVTGRLRLRAMAAP
jgi:hypothetical protein